MHIPSLEALGSIARQLGRFVKTEHVAVAEDFKLVVASTDKIYAAFFSW